MSNVTFKEGIYINQKGHYVRLVIDKDDCKTWSFSSVEERNRVYEKAAKKFENDRYSGVPWIDLETRNHYQTGGSMYIPIRLNKKVKDQVVKYIDSIT